MHEVRNVLIPVIVTAVIVMLLLWLTLQMIPQWSLQNRTVLMACTGCCLVAPWLFLVARWRKTCKR